MVSGKLCNHNRVEMNTGYLVTLSVCFIMSMLISACGEIAVVPPGSGTVDGVDYVNVRDEPQHRHEFENDKIRLYDVLLPVDYVSLQHAHTRDTIYLTISSSKLKSVTLVGSLVPPISIPAPAGLVMFNKQAERPLIHQVTNTGNGSARLIGVEMKNKAAEFTRPPISGTGLKEKKTYSKVRVYKLRLEPGESTGEMDIQFPGLLIAITEATLTEKIVGKDTRTGSMEPASWEWFDAPGKVIYTNEGITTFEAMIYELP